MAACNCRASEPAGMQHLHDSAKFHTVGISHSVHSLWVLWPLVWVRSPSRHSQDRGLLGSLRPVVSKHLERKELALAGSSWLRMAPADSG